jgi:hypothetical protein
MSRDGAVTPSGVEQQPYHGGSVEFVAGESYITGRMRQLTQMPVRCWRARCV